MDQEIAALENAKTWVLTNLPYGKQPIVCKWVYKIKRHVDGSIERYKASKQLNYKLTTTLLFLGYIQSKPDYSLFVKSDSAYITILLVYVNDIVLAGDDIQEIQTVKTLLNAKFNIKDLGQLKYFVGLEIARSQQGINLSQRKYALELLKDAGLLGCQPVSTPIQLGTKFSKTKGKPYSDVHAYRRLLDRLLYLTNTRPYLCFVITLNQFLSNPLEDHYATAIRILRYIKNNPGQGLFFPSNTEHDLKAFNDSDWAACHNTRRSVAGFNVFYGVSLIR
ncbi:uncharacterized mitochondrial protein AtMg00810-like [Vigna umbellata]|uniref:uncharacterized mitochondrial protein AtMg00810-like n=1 Tax=Vigna umbellata TaxID=87088 RepID=UPI001F5F6E64|nr:uncharacterized mitochondrial protein AtMg00810-like [Vigna umbellata]